MINPFEIRIDTRHVARGVDRKQLRLTALDGKKIGTIGKSKEAWITGLRDLESTLVYRGIFQPWQTQKHEIAQELIRSRLAPFREQHLARPYSELAITFGGNAFTLQWNPMTANGAGGDWTLRNPAHTIARLPGGHEDVGYFPNMLSAVWKTVERTLFARDDSIAYADLGETVSSIADRLTTNMKAVR